LSNSVKEAAMNDTDLRPEDDRPDEYPLSERLFAAVRLALTTSDAARIRGLLDPLHTADIADFLEQVEASERREILLLVPEIVDGEVLSDLDEGLREEVISFLPLRQLAEAVRELDSDDVVDLVEDLAKPQQEAVLEALDDADRAAVEKALAYPEYSAGRLMQREVVMAPEHWTVGEAIDHLRAKEDLPEQFYHVVLVDPRLKPVGQVPLGRLMAARREVKLADIIEDDFRTIPVTQSEGDVAYTFNQYHLISVPVVDYAGRLIGVITIDDAMIVLDEEHEEDIMRLANVTEAASISDNALETAKGRLPWLVINLFTASLSAIVISQFEDTIAALVVLAALMPIVASTGGVAGTQSLAVAVRGLATRNLTSANARRIILRELGAGLLNGFGLALVLGLAGTLIFGDVMLGMVLGLAMIVNQVVAALGGVLVPLTLDRMGLDPALASGTFVTTMTDVMGFFAFLGFATIFLI
jgi:magnesium transporter